MVGAMRKHRLVREQRIPVSQQALPFYEVFLPKKRRQRFKVLYLHVTKIVAVNFIAIDEQLKRFNDSLNFGSD